MQASILSCNMTFRVNYISVHCQAVRMLVKIKKIINQANVVLMYHQVLETNIKRIVWKSLRIIMF